MKEIFSNHTRDSFCHSRIGKCVSANWDIFNALSEWAVDEAGGKDKVFGTKPEVAEYTPTDLGTEAGRAVQSNIANQPDIQALLEKILPGYGEMIAQGAKNTNALLKGEIPQDVQDLVRRSSAFKSLSGGYGGSPMSRALTARDLGTTSLALMDKGENSAQRWAGITQGSTAPYMVTAPAQADATFRNNLYEQITKQMKFNVDAAPDPGAAGIFNLQTAMGAMAASFIGYKGTGQNVSTTSNNATMQQYGSNTGSVSEGASSFGGQFGGFGGG